MRGKSRMGAIRLQLEIKPVFMKMGVRCLNGCCSIYYDRQAAWGKAGRESFYKIKENAAGQFLKGSVPVPDLFQQDVHFFSTGLYRLPEAGLDSGHVGIPGLAGEKSGKAFSGFRHSLFRRFLHPFTGPGEILCRAFSGQVKIGKAVLGFTDTLCRRFFIPVHGLRGILFHSKSMFHHCAQIVLGFAQSLSGRLVKPDACLPVILRNAFSLEKHEADIELGICLALVGPGKFLRNVSVPGVFAGYRFRFAGAEEKETGDEGQGETGHFTRTEPVHM